MTALLRLVGSGVRKKASATRKQRKECPAMTSLIALTVMLW